MTVVSQPIKPQGAQKMVHYPSYLRLDPKWYTGASKWSDGTTDADIFLMPSTSLYGGVSQNTSLTINTLLTNDALYLESMYPEAQSRSVANNGYLRAVADSWTNNWKKLKTIRYYTYKKVNKTSFTTIPALCHVNKIIALDTTRFVALYSQAATGAYVVAGSIAADGTVTYGTAQQITSTTCDGVPNNYDIDLIDTDKFVVASIHTSGTSLVFTTVCTVSTVTITVGTPTSTVSGVPAWVRVCKIGTGKFAALWYEASGTNTKAICATVSGTTPTFGAIKTIKNAANATATFIVNTGTDKAVCGVATGVIAMTMTATTTITIGTELTTLNSLAPVEAYSHGTDKFILQHNDNGINGLDNVGLYTVSGTTVTLASQCTVATGGNNTPSNGAFGVRPTWINYATNKASFTYSASSASGSGNIAHAYKASSIAVDFASDVLTVDLSAGGNNAGVSIIGGLDLAANQLTSGFPVGFEKFYFMGNSGTNGNSSAVGRVGVYDLIIGATNSTATTQACIVIKNTQTTFFNNATSLGTQTPTLPGFIIQTFKCDSSLGGSVAYVKLQNTGGETQNYGIADVGMIAE